MKALIEDMLRRDYDGSNANRKKSDIAIALQSMNLILPPGRIFVIADTSRAAEDFVHTIRRPYTHIRSAEMVRGLDNVHIVQLHTGKRTMPQQKLHLEIQETLTTRRGITVWHVGEWR